ncbi:MAG: NAD(P)/FAD-dependent oxidoreductase [Candidatus Eisenbacteria bacterium]|uniref:NAD(P)/FAD-dependent oxidoreductase n=1 Tax=Eiseniibacteriota bacterium TaxID=2212470 RepID=A0A849SKX1_UNCEI|nr:NAD(P)/FAD-dependent oxidoreductase [Candidatus Eisenbacteria bacterium]
MSDLLVIGGGPAGVSAALWAHALDLDVQVIEQAAVSGGQLRRIHFEPPQLSTAVDGAGEVLANRARDRLAERGVPMRLRARALRLCEPVLGVELDSGAIELARAIVIATGLRARPLDAIGAERWMGHGVSDSATRDRERFAGRSMVVVGGGDAAYENALILSDSGCEVLIAQRAATRARARFVARVAQDPRIRVREHVTVLEVLGDTEVSGVRLKRSDGAVESHSCSGVVVKLGQVPNTEWCRDALRLDREGFVRVAAGGRTSRQGVWAAGDVVRPALLAIPVAEAGGAVAARQVFDWFEAGSRHDSWPELAGPG